MLEFVEGGAERRQAYRREHASSTSKIKALEAKLAADIKAVEDNIHAEFAERLNPLVERLRELFEAMTREAAALGRKPA